MDVEKNWIKVEKYALGSDEAKILGSSTALVTTTVVGASVLLGGLNPQVSLQSLLIISEYFQLLLTLLLLNQQLPQVVYDLLNSFQLFKLDFKFLKKLYNPEEAYL